MVEMLAFLNAVLLKDCGSSLSDYGEYIVVAFQCCINDLFLFL